MRWVSWDKAPVVECTSESSAVVMLHSVWSFGRGGLGEGYTGGLRLSQLKSLS